MTPTTATALHADANLTMQQPSVIVFPGGNTGMLTSTSPPVTAPGGAAILTPHSTVQRLISLTSSPHRNIVFQWNSPSSCRQVSMPEAHVKSHGDSRIRGNIPTTASGCRSGASTSPKCSISRPLSSSVQTSVQTTTTGSQVDMTSPLSQDCPQRNALFDQLTIQLEQLHVMFRNGELEAKEYHKRISNLMIQLHTCHPPQTAKILSPIHVRFVNDIPTYTQ